MPGRTYRENRIAQVDTVKRIMLDPLEIGGVQVTSLDPGDYVRYSVYRADDTEWIAESDAGYELVFTNNIDASIYAWSALIRTPPSIQGTTKERLQIKWSYKIGAADDKSFDYLEVYPDPV